MTRRRRRLRAGARASLEAFDERNETLQRRLPLAGGLACRRGCAHCCHQRVSVTPLEALELAASLRASCSEPELERLRARIDEVAARVRGTTALQHRGTPCPLLDAGECRAYASRPLLCRGASSFDAQACATPGAAIPSYAPQTELAQTLQERLDEACRRVSGRAQMLELACALLVALEPDAEARWRAGEPVFSRAAHSWYVGDVLHHWSEAETPTP